MTGSAHIIRGNALALPLADSSVDLIVTSPPYFGLRSYQDNGEHYSGQLGSEATPAEFVDALIAATREMVRVLKPSGSIWVNLGDKYAAGHGGSSTEGNGVNINVGHRAEANFRERNDLPNPPASWGKRDATGRSIVPGFRPKSLMGMPWRYALRCIDDLGLILRAEVIWSKPNGLPESVTDRVRRSHEQWFHFTVRPRYFSAVDEIREEHQHPNMTHIGPRSGRGEVDGNAQHSRAGNNVLGKLPGSVWQIPTQPLAAPPELGIDHFAAFPMEWPRRIIQGWSPSGICVECGEGRRPVTLKKPMEWRAGPNADHYNAPGTSRKAASGTMLAAAETTITGHACSCGTGTETRPSVILDPFGGTGTVALMAKALGRHGISVDMSADYCRLATWRTNDPGEMARAMQVERPEPVHPDQLNLFEDGAA